MKNFTFSALFLTAAMGANAQTAILDSVEMGANYANEVYYRLSDGTKASKPATEWHFGMSTSVASATLIANVGLPSPGMGQAAMNVYKYPNGTNADFATADTTGMSTWTKSFDDSLIFDMGAFNQGATGHPNYGWGNYNNTTHVVNGNTLFIIKIGTTVYKLDIIKKQLGTVTFRYGLLNDPTGTEVVVAASSPTYQNKNYVFFNLETGLIVDRELENWDLWAVKYSDLYNGMAVNQAVTGILTNPKWEVARVDVGTSTQADHLDFNSGTFSSDKNELGQSYKYMTPAYVWEVTSETVYYLKNDEGDVWKWYPTKFVGTGAGKTVFYKQKMASVGIEETTSQFVDIYPNPTQDQITIVFDSKGTATAFTIRNQMGQVVLSQNAQTNFGVAQQKLDISAFTNGMYFLEVTQNGNTMVKSIIKN